uniref:Interleukin 22 receptor subunit alpha 2 n=1 Tax=Paramormyrops kingsleyae TaxID=1676925 RepID=A0A3B3QXW4_9TELE
MFCSTLPHFYDFFFFLICLADVKNISSPVLREVKFHSVDYRNILHWKTQSHPDGNQKYFVQYKIYGEKHWTTARHCQGITQLYCDLSQQTSDPWERYYARVQAEVSGHQSSWVLSPRFNPHWETSVSPPTMRLNVTERAIVVRLKPPKSPYRRRRGSWISMKKLQKLTYRVYLMHSGSIQASATITVPRLTHRSPTVCSVTFLV